MKKKYLSATIIISIVVLFNACKKSDSDPLLPFSTRDARITNSWKLVKQQSDTTIVNELNKTDVNQYNFDGTNMTEKHIDFFGNTSENSYSYSDSLVINKNGTYNRTIISGGNKNNITSYWFWYDSHKNKIGIIFENVGTYLIQKLAKDELIIERYLFTETTDEEGDKSTMTIEEVLTYNKI